MKLLSSYVYGKEIGGAKAQFDIESIANEDKDIKIYNVRIDKDKQASRVYKLFLKAKRYFIVFKNMFTKEMCILQVPFTNENVMSILKKKTAFIHDIHGLQFCDEKVLKKELEFYKKCNFVIAHNDSMAEFLINNGISKDKIIILEIFDYLCEARTNNRKFDKNNIVIAYTGNFNKSPFLMQLDAKKMKFKISLYGFGNLEFKNEKIRYYGSFPPNELPNKIDCDLGLVWDGNYDESDEKEGFKRYTKYNNPHKFSCYIAAGVPVIVWEKSAISKIVERYNIGYTIKNIYDINDIDFSDYEEKKNNVLELSNKVRKGYFTKKIFNEIKMKKEK